jgi:hypothetical protein
LNTFGKNFQLHGYQQPGDRLVNKIEFPEDKNLLIPDQLPIAFLIENQLILDKTVGNQNADSITSPFAFHLFAADTFAPDMGFFGELATVDGTLQIGKVQAVFSDLGDRNIFAQVGNLDPTEHGVTEHDLFARSGYGIQDIGLGSSGSPYVLSAQHVGARIYGLIGAEVTPDLIHGKSSGQDSAPAVAPDQNGGGLPMRILGLQKKPKPSDEDEQEAPDPMDRLTGFLWEFGVYNSINVNGNPDNPNPSDFEARLNAYFNGDSFVGVSGYSGLMTIGSGLANHYQFGGPDFSLYYGKPMEKTKNLYIKPFNLIGGYITGQASNPNDTGNKVSWNGYYLEQDYTPNPRSICFLRYDKVNCDNLQDLMPTGITNALTVNYTYYFRTNFWVGAEYTQDLSGAKQNLLGILFDFAF